MCIRLLFVLLLCGIPLFFVDHAQSVPPGPPPGKPPSPPYGPTSIEPNTERKGDVFTVVELPQSDVGLCRSACDRNGRCAA
jgi:hypothetical protein